MQSVDRIYTLHFLEIFLYIWYMENNPKKQKKTTKKLEYTKE